GWQMPSAESLPTLAVRLREGKPAAQCQIVAVVDQSNVDVHWIAHLDQIAGAVYQYRLIVPPDLEIDNVEMSNKGDKVPCRWSRKGWDMFIFFLSAAPAEAEILVHAHLPLATDLRFALPAMQLENASSNDFRAFVFRRPEALVELLDAGDL